jgi:hypothetical protein
MMREEQLVQFVRFETTLDKEQFIAHWENFTRSANSDHNVTLQQSKNNGLFRYLAQHRSANGGFKFIFEKARRSSKDREIAIKVEQAGGYSISQLTKRSRIEPCESKVFCFLSDPRADLCVYQQLSSDIKLNIYEPYYENCKYAFILEYFVKSENAESLLQKIKLYNSDEAAVYNECMMNLKRVLH